MTTIAKVMSLAFPASPAELEILKVLMVFCGIGLLISLSVASYGLDLSQTFSECAQACP